MEALDRVVVDQIVQAVSVASVIMSGSDAWTALFILQSSVAVILTP
jgi:hypothetical protein